MLCVFLLKHTRNLYIRLIVSNVVNFVLIIMSKLMLGLLSNTTPDYGLGTVGKCLGPTTSKGPTKDGCKIC